MLKVILLWQLINCTEINHTCNRLPSNRSGTTYLMLFNSVPHSEDWFKPWLKLFLFKSQSIFWSWSFSTRLQIAFKNLLIIMNSIGYERVFVIDSISTERHRAEVRRAYSDDRLAIVAERYILLIPDICWKILNGVFSGLSHAVGFIHVIPKKWSQKWPQFAEYLLQILPKD